MIHWNSLYRAPALPSLQIRDMGPPGPRPRPPAVNLPLWWSSLETCLNLLIWTSIVQGLRRVLTSGGYRKHAQLASGRYQSYRNSSFVGTDMYLIPSESHVMNLFRRGNQPLDAMLILESYFKCRSVRMAVLYQLCMRQLHCNSTNFVYH